MTGDRSKFLTLSDSKSGNVTFGNDAPRKIKGKGIILRMHLPCSVVNQLMSC
jgi:hypothetical protein